MVDKRRISNTLVNTKLEQIKELENHAALLQSQISRLAAIKTTIEKPMRVAIFLVFLFSFTELAPVIVLVNTLPESSAI